MGLLYQKRRLKVNKIRRKINATRTNLQRFRVLLSLIMIGFIIYFGLKIVKLSSWYIDADKLNAADPSVLKIQGNIITPDYKIIDAIRQTQLPCTQIFRLETDELERNISQLQSVKKVYIRRYWHPARLIVMIDERVPAFLLVPNLESEPRSALTTDGVIIDHDYLPFKPSIKAKKLLTYGIRDGVDETWDKKKVEELLKLVKAFEIYSNQEVQYVDIRNQKDIYIMLKEYLIRLGEINDSTFERAKLIASILPEAKKHKNVKYIDLRWEDSYYLRLEGAKENKKTQKETKAKQNSENSNKKQENNTNITEENINNQTNENAPEIQN